MFTDFLYLLRSYGMKTSLNEWNSLMDALEMNLNDASLTEFYVMSLSIIRLKTGNSSSVKASANINEMNACTKLSERN